MQSILAEPTSLSVPVEPPQHDGPGSLRTPVLVFREELLRISEIFIKSQADALQTFQPIYLGLRRAGRSLTLSAPSLLLSRRSVRAGYFRAMGYRVAPWAPLFHRRIARCRPALIHAHFAPDAAQVMHLRKLLGVPLMVTLHGYDIFMTDAAFRKSVRGRYFLAMRQQLWKTADRFLCVSEAVRSAGLRAGIPEHKLIVHYTGVDMQQFEPAPQETREPKLVLFVGRLVEKKGCAVLLEAMRRLPRGMRARVEIIGDGPLRAKLEAMARSFGVGATFAGVQPAARVRQRMKEARVLCVPSLEGSSGDREGFGMVFAEAQALGTPVVSSFHSAIPEVVLHEKTGLLAPEKDAERLAQHLASLLVDEALWARLSRAGQDHVRANFDLELQTRKLEQIYADTIAEYASVPGLTRASLP